MNYSELPQQIKYHRERIQRCERAQRDLSVKGENPASEFDPRVLSPLFEVYDIAFRVSHDEVLTLLATMISNSRQELIRLESIDSVIKQAVLRHENNR